MSWKEREKKVCEDNEWDEQKKQQQKTLENTPPIIAVFYILVHTSTSHSYVVTKTMKNLDNMKKHLA